jgi:hypothetical protein
MKYSLLMLIALTLSSSACRAELVGYATNPKTPPPAKFQTLSPEDIDILNAGRVSTAQYVVGGITATVFGFGVGAAIEGRYTKVGWIFTTGEVVFATAALIDIYAHTVSSGLVAGFSSALGAPTPSNALSYIGPVGIIGLAGYGGLRIWEIIDGWVSPPIQNAAYDEVKSRTDTHRNSSISFVPLATACNTHSPGMTLGLSF